MVKQFGKSAAMKTFIVNHMGKMRPGEKLVIMKGGKNNTGITRNSDQLEKKDK